MTVRYRPYFLNPWVPRAGISRTEYLTTKFGSVDRYKANAQRIVLAARQDGLTYNPDAIARQPDASDRISRTLFVGLAMIESLAIYSLVIALIARAFGQDGGNKHTSRGQHLNVFTIQPNRCRY